MVLQFGRKVNAVILADVADGIRWKFLGFRCDAEDFENLAPSSKVSAEGSGTDVGQSGQRAFADESFLVVVIDHKLLFKQIIDEVYLALLLLRRGTQFQQRTDCDVAAVQAAGFTGDLIPTGVGRESGIGIGEEDDAVTAQRKELVGSQFEETTGGQPQLRGIVLTEYYRRLLCLNHSDV